MPTENLITPDFVRRVCWDQTRADEKSVAEKLIKLGARTWQIEQVAPLLAAALKETEPLATPEDAPDQSLEEAASAE
jgi:ribonuclease D